MSARGDRSYRAFLIVITVLAILSLVFLKVFVVGGGLALYTGGGEVSTTVVTLTGATQSTTSGSNLNYSNIPSIFVSAEYPNGTAIPGVYTALVQNGNTLSSSATPVIFQVPTGQ